MCDHPKGFTSESIPTRGGSGSSSPPGGAAAGGGAGGAGGLPAAMVRGSPVCFAMYSTTWWPLHPSAFASAMSQPWRSGSMVYATMWTSLATPFSACASAIIARMPGCSCSGMRSPAFGWFSGESWQSKSGHRITRRPASGRTSTRSAVSTPPIHDTQARSASSSAPASAAFSPSTSTTSASGSAARRSMPYSGRFALPLMPRQCQRCLPSFGSIPQLRGTICFRSPSGSKRQIYRRMSPSLSR
ncbi:hypothetical protein D3C72_844190 [compost metagenome]